MALSVCRCFWFLGSFAHVYGLSSPNSAEATRQDPVSVSASLAFWAASPTLPSGPAGELLISTAAVLLPKDSFGSLIYSLLLLPYGHFIFSHLYEDINGFGFFFQVSFP